MGIYFRTQMCLHELWVPQRSAKDHDTLGPLKEGSRRLSKLLHQGPRHVLPAATHFDVSWLHVNPVPYLGFALVDLDPCMVPQLRPQQMVDLHHSLWSTHDVNVVKEGHEMLIREQTFVQPNQSSVLAHCEQGGH